MKCTFDGVNIRARQREGDRSIIDHRKIWAARAAPFDPMVIGRHRAAGEDQAS